MCGENTELQLGSGQLMGVSGMNPGLGSGSEVLMRPWGQDAVGLDVVMCWNCCCCSSVAKLCPALCGPRECSTAGFSVLHYLLEFAQTHVHWVSDAIQPSHPLSSCPQSFPTLGFFPVSQFFASGGQTTEASASASVLPMNIQCWFSLGFTGLTCPRDSQESSPAPQFESINSLALSLPYGPTLPSVHNYWKNHSFDYMDLCWQSDVAAF